MPDIEQSTFRKILTQNRRLRKRKNKTEFATSNKKRIDSLLLGGSAAIGIGLIGALGYIALDTKQRNAFEADDMVPNIKLPENLLSYNLTPSASMEIIKYFEPIEKITYTIAQSDVPLFTYQGKPVFSAHFSDKLEPDHDVMKPTVDYIIFEHPQGISTINDFDEIAEHDPTRAQNLREIVENAAITLSYHQSTNPILNEVSEVNQKFGPDFARYGLDHAMKMVKRDNPVAYVIMFPNEEHTISAYSIEASPHEIGYELLSKAREIVPKGLDRDNQIKIITDFLKNGVQVDDKSGYEYLLLHDLSISQMYGSNQE